MTRAATTTYALLLATTLAVAVVRNDAGTLLEWHLCVAAIALIALVYWIRPYAGRGYPGLRSAEAGRASSILPFLAPAYVAFQLLPLPLPLLRLLSPQRAELTDALGAVMSPLRFAPLSVDPEATAMALITLLACVLSFLLVRELTWSSLRRGSWLMIFPLMAIAVFQAAVALWQAWSGTEVAGTYWNRNHLAGLLEMVLPLCVVYAVSANRKDMGVLVPMVLILLIFLGVVASGSKLGYLSTLFGLIAMGLMVGLTRFSGVAKWACIAALPVLGMTAFAVLGNQDVLVRLANVFETPDGMDIEGRVPIWADTLRLLAAYPMFGSGLETYMTSFLAFQTTGLANLWDHAHNDYLELATDLGIVGLAVFGALIVVVARYAVGLTRQRRRSGSDLVALGCLGAFAAIGLHSVGDFNLYTSGNAMVLAWIAGIAAGIPLPSKTQPAEPGRAASPEPAIGPRRRFDVRVAAIVMSAIALAMSSTAIARSAATPVADATPGRLTLDQQLDAVRKSPAWPYGWLDLAEGLMAEGRTDAARASVSHALTLAPFVRSVVRRSATLFDALGDRPQAVTLMTRELKETGIGTRALFDWFVERGIPRADVLAELANHPRALPAYLRYLMLPGTCREAGRAWQALSAYSPDPGLAGAYVNFVRDDCEQPDEADRAWTDYATSASPGYRLSDWVFNGDFERDPVPVPFDWRWDSRDAALDTAHKFSGSRSLRIMFRGPSRADSLGAGQIVAVAPGTYRFTAAVRTLGLATADGVFFEINNISGGASVVVRTEQTTGTTEWRVISADVVIPEGVTQVRIQVVRRPGAGALKEDDLNATAWVDAITLSKVG